MSSRGGEGTVTDQSNSEWLAGTILQAAEQAGIGVTVTVANEGLHNVMVTPAAAAIFGRDESGLLARDPFCIFSAEERAKLERSTDTRSADQLPRTLETSLTHPDGTSVSLEVGLGPISVGSRPGVLAFITDVTYRRRALESLQKSEERFRSVVESIQEVVFMTEGTSVTYANRAFAALFGVKPSASAPIDVRAFFLPMDAPRLERQTAELTPDGNAAHAEYRLRAEDGREIVLETSAIGVGFDEVRAVLWLGQDVTQRRLLEGKLMQTDRLSALGTLAAGMAHAINNPLSYTLLNLEHVARRMRSLAAGQDYYAEARVRLAEAHDGADRVAKVVRQMRTLSRSRTSPPAPVDLRAVLENVLAMIGNEIRYRGQLATRFDPAPKVFAREGELEQAFLGLLLYVARSRPEETSQARELVLFVGSEPGGSALVTVYDDGPPLDPEMRARLLDPFASGETVGLGLAMCNSIFTALGGRMDVESSPELGTTFSVVLPASGADAAQDSQKHPSSPPPPSGTVESRLRVLVIDDDPGVASTLRAMLEAHHEVTSVESAREGLRLLLGADRFDIAFCDLVMPEVSGIDLYCALELNRPEATASIVFMTGGVFTPEAERFLARVPNRRIEKPFSLVRVDQLLVEAMRARVAEPS
jgi:PAS domain S-box-containing protein